MLVDVDITGLHKMLKMISLRLQIGPTRLSMFANVAINMAGMTAAISLVTEVARTGQKGIVSVLRKVHRFAKLYFNQ
jgi:hypothetical protein